MTRLVGCLTALVLLATAPTWAYDGIVEKKTFAMPAYATVGGTTIKVLSGKGRQVHWMVHLASAAFIVYFALPLIENAMKR